MLVPLAPLTNWAGRAGRRGDTLVRARRLAIDRHLVGRSAEVRV